MDWRDGKVRLFLSHVSRRKVFAAKVSELLAPLGVDGFVAHDDIPGSQEWRTEILEALDECDAIALFLHKTFYKSDWCDQETGVAIGHRKKVIPLRFEDDAMPRGFAGAYQAIDCRNGAGARYVTDEIVKSLARDTNIGADMKEALVVGLQQSSSFADSNIIADMLKRVIPDDDWTMELVDGLVASFNNGQVEGAWDAKRYIKHIKNIYTAPF